MPPEQQERRTAKQVFDIPRWIESQLSEMNLKVAMGEMIDNFVDEKLEDHPTNITILFNLRQEKMVFDCRGTSGMPAEKMEEYPLWGGKHIDPNMIKEHRLGGKLATLYFLSKDTGNLLITSAPAGASRETQMHIPTWWQNLDPNVEFAINERETTIPEPVGRTRFELQGVQTDKIPTGTQLRQLAEDLGLTYGPLLLSQRLSIELRLAGGQRLDVLPVTVPFQQETVRAKQDVPTGKKGKGPRINVEWGFVDMDQKNREELARQAVYQSGRKSSSIEGQSVYYYYHGRLLTRVPLAQLKIPGYVRKQILDNFAVCVDISKGWAPKTILKTGLSVSSEINQEIDDKVVKLIQEDVQNLLAEPSEGAVPAGISNKAKEASQALSLILNNIFENNPQKVAEEFHLPTVGFGYAERKRTSSHGDAEPSLPGAIDVRKERPPTKHSTGELQKAIWINPVPEIRISHLGANYPDAELSIDEDSGKPVVILNYSHPEVLSSLHYLRGKQLLMNILRISANALYHEKWVRLESLSARSYEDGKQRDVANFLETAQKLKVIP